MNGFEQHKIKHASPSSISLWESNPAMWVASYLLKKKRPGAPAMTRGIVIEDAVVAALSGKSVDDAVATAEKSFDEKIFLADDKSEKERASIRPITELSVEALKEFGAPQFDLDGRQQKVSINCNGDGWKLPIIGYLDLVYPDEGLVIDLKTTMRLPSTMMSSHKRQRCFYQKCMGNLSVKFLYVTPKKSIILEDGNVDAELNTIKQHLNRLERFLRISDDPEYLAAIVPVDPTHFYWSDCTDLRKEVFEI